MSNDPNTATTTTSRRTSAGIRRIWTQPVDRRPCYLRVHNHEHFNAQTGPITATSGIDKLNVSHARKHLLVTHGSSVLRPACGRSSHGPTAFRPRDPARARLVHMALPTSTNVRHVAAAMSAFIPPLKVHPYQHTHYKRIHPARGQWEDVGPTAPRGHAAVYNSWLPSLDVHTQGTSMVYAQYGKGDAIPPTKV
jgi:hypothetical protein